MATPYASFQNLKSELKREDRLYQLPFPIIGITGGIATGKSTFCNLLKSISMPVLDADDMVKKIYRRHEVVDQIKKIIPLAVESNTINFPTLRAAFFSDKDLKKKIESIIYSHLPDQFLSEIKNLGPNIKFVFYEVPLLFELGLESKFDLVVCVYAPKKIQLERIMLRDGSSIEIAEKILNQQVDIEIKSKKSDVVITNDASVAEIRPQFDKFLVTYFN